MDGQLRTAQPGEVIDLDDLMPEPVAKQSETGGRLLYSNNPEYFPGVADTALTLLCRNPVPPGRTRCFIYHANRSGRRAKVTVILEPAGGPAVLWLRKRALAQPSVDYTGIGRQVQYDWFRSGLRRSVPVFGPTLLDGALDEWSGGDGDLFHAIWTWESDQPVLATVAALPAEADSLELVGSHALVAREGLFSPCPESFRARGVFAGTKRVAVRYHTDLGFRYIPVGHRFCTGDPIADTPTYDGWVPGHDLTPLAPGDTAELGPYLPGNFGVLYRTRFLLSGTRPVAVLLNPRGGNIQGAFSASPGLTPGGTTAYGPVVSPRQAVLLGRYAPPAAPRVDLMPAGAANLPWRVLLLPYGDPSLPPRFRW